MSTKTSAKSGQSTQAQQTAYLGGMPPKKTPEQIAKVNHPSSRSKAPGAVRV